MRAMQRQLRCCSRLWLLGFQLSLGLACSQVVQAEQATLAVASNFAPAITALVQAFEGDSEHRLVVATGSSGKLYAQIRHGAPFDLFFSADQDKPKALVAAGLTTSATTYAIGKLALWSPSPGLAHKLKSQLVQGDYQRLALANPKLAPYGAAAAQTMQALGVTLDAKGKAGTKHTQRKWVRGENIAQTFQFVMTGNTDLGFVALSQISQAGQISRGSAWLVPESLHQPIRQDVVLLQSAQTNQAAIEFLEFVRSERGRGIINGYGYRTPTEQPTTAD